MAATHLRILAVDDEREILRMLSVCLSTSGHEVVTHISPADALRDAGQQTFDMVLLDLRLSTENGMDYIEPFLRACPWIRIVMITAHADVRSAVEAMRRGAHDYITKPFTPVDIRAAAASVRDILNFQQRAEDDEVEEPALDFGSICREMREAMSRAHRAAENAAVVRIRGERGIGKSTLARMIHRGSDRRARRFGTVSCRAPAQMIEAELFGLAPNPGAARSQGRAGRIGECSGGTILLEHADHLPGALHQRMHHLLQDGLYHRAGEDVSRNHDVRFIGEISISSGAAASPNSGRWEPPAMAVIEIELPPLRHRPDDIVRLAEAQLAFFARQNRKPITGFSKSAIAAIRAHTWPDNIRELRNTVERAAINCRSARVQTEDFEAGSLNRYSTVTIGDPVPLDRVEELHIRSVLAGSPTIEAAASVLGMDPVTLWRRRKQYGM